MALITRFEEVAQSGSESVHGDVSCGFKTFALGDKTYMQLDTYGSSDRKLTGKVSQSIQLDEAGAAYLAGMIARAFPNIRDAR